ncbi:hypothetical protein HPB49_007231 [Dermacentor silvarum]|uniref:Uncharacterized protein n=1 Tax=Dermacentor silvarum TaxID=543639 RepID=A0ACB8DX16_DERSI|nr:hypothetical protein HPB49_007231 [Dermacentor silvarum]
MARFVRLEERIASVDNRVATIESHLTALDTRVAVLEARQSATEATLAHLSLPAPLPPAPTPTPSDSRLLHLWEAYHAVHRRWQAQKHNRRLRFRLARLASNMEEHCSSLLRQQWGQTCDRMAGNLGLRDTWSLLRVLLDPTHTKASQREDISHLLHSSPLTDTDFLAALRDRYLCTDPPTTLPAYTGSPNPDLEADISLGEGTPQGSVLSPLLFNVTPFPLARALRTIPALSHAFYADDITLWVTTGNLGDMETTLQAGVDAVATHARSVGLSCSPDKSELLLFLPRGMAPLSPSPLTVSLDGTPISLVSTLRILGLFLQSNGRHTTLITRLTNTVHQTIRLIRRIANRHHGMREHVLRRLVHAFVLSRFIYSLPYIFLSRTEEDKVNSLIRQAYNSALSLPTSTSTARLLSMGVHNSLTELTEAHRTAQLLRKPSKLCEETKPNWAPTLLLGYKANNEGTARYERAARRWFKRTTPEVDAVTAAPARAFGVGATPPENRYDDGDDDRTYTDSPLKTVEIKT